MSLLAALMTALIHSIWQVALLGAIYAAARLALRRPQDRYAMALATLAAQVAWPAVAFVKALEPRALQISASIPDGRWWIWVPAVWTFGAALMLLRFLGALLSIRRLLTRSQELEAAVASKFAALCARLGVRRTRFLGSGQIDSPITFGFWRPVVLVPAAMLTAIPIATLELLVAHELMHVRRWDYLVNLFQSLAEALLFFHPALWWVSRCAREEREYCCDDGVVTYLGQGRTLAQALVELEQHRQPGGALAVASTGGSFMNRIRRLIADRHQSRTAWPFALAFVAAVALTAACAAAIEESQPVPKAIQLPLESASSLKGLCQAMRDSACKPENAAVPASDIMTVVFNELSEKNPAVAMLGEGIMTVPPPLKRGVVKQSISEVIGEQWDCADFDAMWEAETIKCAPN